MLELIQYMAGIGGSISTLIIVLGLIPGSPIRNAFEAWIQRRVAHGFDKALEDHRHQLTLEAESVKAKYQTDIHNLGIVAERRHEVCRELFRLLFTAHGSVSGLFGAREVQDFSQYSLEEITGYMTSRRLGSMLKDPVLAAWDTDRKEALKEFQKADRLVEVSGASDAYREAYNYFLTTSLYLPDEVTDLARKIFDTLLAILGAAKFPEGSRGTDTLALQNQASEMIWQMRGTLQALLGVTVETRKALGG